MNKGFTLIELLATIVIMTVILLMVLPSITALQENNEDRPYEYYGDSIEEAAKTYVTKEGEDITDLGVEQWEGCVDITYDDLISSGLIKPFDDPDYNCSINTKVRYTKDAEGRETFEYNMTCEDEEGNKVYEHKGIEDDGECTVIDQSDFTPPECGEAIGESTEWTTEERTITMTCHDENGCESVTKTFDKSTKIGYITVEDGKGNKRNCPVNVYIDKTPPKCSSSGGSDSWTNGSRTLTGICTDDESGCVGNVSKLYNSEGNFTSQSPGTVSDKVGNTTVCPNNQTVRIDRTKPVYTSVYAACGDPQGVGHKGYVKLFFADTLSGLGVRTVHYWDAGNNVYYPNVNHNGAPSGGDTLGTGGTWLGFEHTICDMAGNCSQWNDSNVRFSC